MAEMPTPIIVAVDDGGERGGFERAPARSGRRRARRREAARARNAGNSPAAAPGSIAAVRAMAPMHVDGRERLRARRGRRPPRPRDGAAIVAIAASTGGPAAFARDPRRAARRFRRTDPASRSTSRAASSRGWCAGSTAPCRLSVKLAEHGERLRPATVYVAGDDRHLTARDRAHDRAQRRSAARTDTGRRLGDVSLGRSGFGSRGARGGPDRHGTRRHRRAHRDPPRRRRGDRPGRGQLGGLRDAQSGDRCGDRRPRGPALAIANTARSVAAA